VATLCNAVEIPGEGPQPDIHAVEVPEAGSVEGFLLPLGGDRYEVHFTFVGADGKTLAVEGVPAMVASGPGEEPVDLRPLFLARGHFFAEAKLAPGEWRFDGSATGDGTSLAGCFEQNLGS
jgi:hypothetical protein